MGGEAETQCGSRVLNKKGKDNVVVGSRGTCQEVDALRLAWKASTTAFQEASSTLSLAGLVFVNWHMGGALK